MLTNEAMEDRQLGELAERTARRLMREGLPQDGPLEARVHGYYYGINGRTLGYVPAWVIVTSSVVDNVVTIRLEATLQNPHGGEGI